MPSLSPNFKSHFAHFFAKIALIAQNLRYENVDLSVAKLAPSTAALGSTLVYTLAVANPNSITPALDVLLIDNPPTGIELTGVADQRCGLVQGVLNCNLGVVAPLATETISITARAITDGNWNNTAQISGANETGGANNTASANTTVTTDSPAPHLALQKVLLAPSSGVARPGDAVLFALQIENRGGITVSEIALVDRYDPAYLNYNAASIPPTAQTTGVLTWTLSAAPLPLAPGAAMTITVEFTATRP